MPVRTDLIREARARRAAQTADAPAAPSPASGGMQAALPEEPAVTGADIMGALQERAAANGLNIDASPPVDRTDRRTAMEKLVQSPSPSGFNAEVSRKAAAESAARAKSAESMTWDAQHAAWQRAEEERRAKINAEIASRGRVDLADFPATPMPRAPKSVLESGTQKAFRAPTGDFEPAAPGETNVPRPRGRDIVGVAKRGAGGLKEGSDAAQYQAAIDALKGAEIDGMDLRRSEKSPLRDRVVPVKDPAGRVTGSKVVPADIVPHDEGPSLFNWAPSGGLDTTNPDRFRSTANVSGPGTQAPASGGKKGGGKRPASDAQRQIDSGGARMREEIRLLDAGIPLPTERDGPPRLPRAPAPETPTRITQLPVPNAGDRSDPSALTPEQQAAMSDGRHVPVPFGGPEGKSVWGLRAVPDRLWAELHAGAVREVDGKKQVNMNLVLSRLADKLGLPQEMDEGERIARAGVFYKDQERLRKTHDIVALPTGGSRFVPNQAMRQGIDNRKLESEVKRFIQAHPFEQYGGGRDSTAHIQELLDAAGRGDEESVNAIKKRVRNGNMAAQVAAARNHSNLRGRMQNLRSPTLGPALAAQEMQKAYQTGNPRDVAAAAAGLGDFQSARGITQDDVDAGLHRDAIDAQTDIALDTNASQVSAAKFALEAEQARVAAEERKASREARPYQEPLLANQDFVKGLADGSMVMAPDQAIDMYHANSVAASPQVEGARPPTRAESELALARSILHGPYGRGDFRQVGGLYPLVQHVANQEIARLYGGGWTQVTEQEAMDHLARTIGLSGPLAPEIARAAVRNLKPGFFGGTPAASGPSPTASGGKAMQTADVFQVGGGP